MKPNSWLQFHETVEWKAELHKNQSQRVTTSVQLKKSLYTAERDGEREWEMREHPEMAMEEN